LIVATGEANSTPARVPVTGLVTRGLVDALNAMVGYGLDITSFSVVLAVVMDSSGRHRSTAIAFISCFDFPFVPAFSLPFPASFFPFPFFPFPFSLFPCIIVAASPAQHQPSILPEWG
jgi:hypothetical protein